jgi:hypothetical protein
MPAPRRSATCAIPISQIPEARAPREIAAAAARNSREAPAIVRADSTLCVTSLTGSLSHPVAFWAVAISTLSCYARRIRFRRA